MRDSAEKPSETRQARTHHKMNGSLNDMLNDELFLGLFFFCIRWPPKQCLIGSDVRLYSVSFIPIQMPAIFKRDKKDKSMLEERSWRGVSVLQFTTDSPAVSPCFRESLLGFPFTLVL